MKIRLLATVLVVARLAVPAHSQTYEVIELAPLAGHSSCDARSVQNGKVVGRSFGGSPQLAVSWDLYTGQANAVCSPQTFADTVTPGGWIVGGDDVDNTDAFVRDPQGACQTLSRLLRGGCYPFDIDAAAQQVVGYSWVAPNHSPSRAVVWTRTGTTWSLPVDLGTLGGNDSQARNINAAGEIAGYAGDASQIDRPVVWSPVGPGTYTTLQLPDLGMGGRLTDAQPTYQAGWYACGRVTDPATGDLRAAVWQNGTLIWHGNLPGLQHALLFDMNAAGQMVGWAWTGSPTQPTPQPTARAILHDGTNLVDLNTLIDPKSPGWVVREAWYIDDQGQIAGRGYNGQIRGVVLNCPDYTTVYCTAKPGLICGTPSISAMGEPIASNTSGYVIQAAPARSNRTGILLYTSAGRANLPFPSGGHILCISPPIRRGGPVDSGGTLGPNCDGVFALDMNAFAHGKLPPPAYAPAPFLLTPGQQVNVQWWGRDTVATGSFMSDALEYTVCP